MAVLQVTACLLLSLMPGQRGNADERGYLIPSWVAANWQVSADRPFLPIREEFEDLLVRWQGGSSAAKQRAISEYDRWRKSKNDPLQLYRATYAVLIARAVDANFDPEAPVSPVIGRLLNGWSDVKGPASLEFARIGYAISGGMCLFGNLQRVSDALLKKQPYDERIIPAFISETFFHGLKQSEQDRALALAKEYVAKRPDRPVRLLVLASAQLMRWTRHKDIAGLDDAVKSIDKFLATNPQGQQLKNAREWKDSLLAWRKRAKG